MDQQSVKQEESFESKKQLTVEKQQFTADFCEAPLNGRISKSGKQLKVIECKSESKQVDLKQFLNTPSKTEVNFIDENTQFQKS